jgi:hypothetical protein
MPVTLKFNGVEYDLFIAAYTPGQDAFREGGAQPVFRPALRRQLTISPVAAQRLR